MAASVSAASCDAVVGGGGDKDEECRDEAAALRLKMVAVAAILIAGAAGVAIPLVGRRRRGGGGGGGGGASSGGLFVLAKAFAAGVILATGFVHMLHDAEHALSSPCLPAHPWRSFPFPGFVAMSAALATLVLDFLATRFYEGKHRAETERVKAAAAAALAASSASDDDITVVTVTEDDNDNKAPLLQPHSHSHSHPHGHGHGHELAQPEGSDGEGEVPAQVRSVVVSQVFHLFSELEAEFINAFLAQCMMSDEFVSCRYLRWGSCRTR